MRIQEQQPHDVLREQAGKPQIGGDEVVHQQLIRSAASSCSSKPSVAQAASTSTSPTTCASERWRQLRKMIKHLTRGMRKYPTTSESVSSASSMDREGPEAQANVAAGASMLHKDFWLEALDEQHRYGFHLRAFHRAWKDAMATAATHAATADDKKQKQKNASFFYWLDLGDGKALELPECSRHALQSMCVQYCDAEARKLYQVQFFSTASSSSAASASRQQRPEDAEPANTDADASVVLAEYAATHELVHTDELSKWIFVIDLDGNMYVGRKRKGVFHHSSFVAGAPIFAAGKIMIKHGKIIAIEPHSGHFKPTLRNLTALCRILRDQHVDLDQIAFIKPKKWSCAWPFPDLPSHLEGCELEDLASDTDYYSYKSDSEEQE